VQTRKGTHYVPIVKTNGKCKLDIKGHPGIDMTNRCGKDITEDLNFHSANAKKQWSKVCKYDPDGYLMNSDDSCLTKKESSCTVMFRMKNNIQGKRSMKLKKSLKKSVRQRPDRKRISLKDLVARPVKDVEAGRVPIFVERGHNVTISGLINCIGVIVTQYSSETGAPVSVIAGHFETPKMYDSVKHTLTKSGEGFAARIVNLMHRIDPDLQTTVQFVYGDSDPDRIVSSNVIGKIPNDTGEAFSALKEKLGLHHVKLEPIVGRNKSKITIRIPH